ncbi:MAG: hypothetical protein AAGI92_05475 [Pseudomonadota bacterium]
MITEKTLAEAEQRKIITATQRAEILSLVHSENLAVSTTPHDLPPSANEDAKNFADENIRLIGGGNDLFVTVGIVLVGAGLYFALSTFFGDQSIVLASLLAVSAWALAEFVTRQHRMKLSSTVLALLFVTSAGTVIGNWVWETFNFEAIQTPQQVLGLRPVIGQSALIAFGTVIAVSVVYFWRFRVPVLSAIVAVSFTALAFIFTALFFYDGVIEGQIAMPSLLAIPDVVANALYVPLICGVLVFLTGVWLDLHDRERVTIWSDCAFWLHVISAPLLVHPLFILATGQDIEVGVIEPTASASVMLTLLILGFVYVALAIDRRSLLIPTLAYFGTLGIYYLIDTAANQTGIPPFALILLVIGALIMIFGAGWQKIRNLIVRPTLPTSVINKLPPIRI